MNAEEAGRWLAQEGVIRTGEDTWVLDQDVWPGEPGTLSANDVAHDWAESAMTDPDLDLAGRIRLTLGLVDLLGEYWVTVEMGFVMEKALSAPEAEVFWDGYRSRLESPEDPKPITYSLWVDWFEDAKTVEVAFAEVLGNEVEALRAAGRPEELGRAPLAYRARWVLQYSGPVPWAIKQPAYQAASAIPELHPALFKGILASYHDFYGSLEPLEALALLRRLRLPADTEHLAALRIVLEAGHRNHYRSPDAWDAAWCR